MAEFLAVTGGLAAVIQLAASGRRFAKILYRFAVDAGAAAAEVERFANQVRTFSDTVEVAEQTLSRYCRDNPASPLVVFMDRRKVLANIDSEATTVRTHLRAVRDQVIDMKSRSILWASIKWSWKKSSILELSPEMESVKTSLSLLMVTAQFEAMVRSGNDNDRLKKTIRRLRRVIKHHLETMRDLRVQLDPARFDGTDSYDSLDLDLTPEDPLEELGWSMYERGMVPDSPPTSPPSSEDRLNVPKAQPSPPNQPRRTRTRRMPTERRDSDPTPPPPTPSQPGGSAPSLRRVSPRRPPPSYITNWETNPVNVSQPPHALTNNTLRYREEDIDESIVGYVRSSAGVLRKAPAFLIGTLDGNIISIGKARELDLEIMALEPGEGATFDFGTGRPERSIGKTVFQWKQSDSSVEAPQTVTCDVCENSAVGLVLGRPFIERAGRTRRGSMYG